MNKIRKLSTLFRSLLFTLVILISFILSHSIQAAPLMKTIILRETYVWLMQWGGNMVGGSFGSPHDLTFDPVGNAYVIDSLNHRIVKISNYQTSSTPPFTTWDGPTLAGGQFYPMGIAIDLPDPDTGNRIIYATDWQNNLIWKLDPAAGRWEAFTGDIAKMVKTPRGIAIDSSGNLYVVDGNWGKIYRFNRTGKILNQWSSPGTNYGGPGIAVDRSGNVYAADINNCRIIKYSSRGGILKQWGGKGQGDGQFHPVNGPGGIAVDRNGNVYVADPGNCRIQKFSNAGVFISQCLGSDLTSPKNLYFPKSVAIDPSGLVFVVDTGNKRILGFENKLAPLDRKLIQPNIIR